MSWYYDSIFQMGKLDILCQGQTFFTSVDLMVYVLGHPHIPLLVNIPILKALEFCFICF
jgi:hypothetical protein